MKSYKYVKKKQSVQKLTIRFMSYIIMTVGFGLLIWAVYPILTYELRTRLLAQTPILQPTLTDEESVYPARAILGETSTLSQNVREFLQLQDWFPNRPQLPSAKDTFNVKEYWLSIPKLNIQNAKVAVAGDDLTKSLVHYLPSTTPGEYGSVNIFGHSTLPQLYNVKDYKTIFTHVPDLSPGDSIFVTYDNQEYEYAIYDMFVVKPDQISVLEPRYDASYLTLITCVPPGTYWNRLIVRSKLKHVPFKQG
ncbi:sortase [Candidatus Woesebacteria bacterium]|nr:sortase [Candidatus Woesebacteria bacterium]